MSSPVPTVDQLFPSHRLEAGRRVSESFFTEFPDLEARYGDRGRKYCDHDNAYLLTWLEQALDAPGGPALLASNIEWLGSVLEARGFPMDAFRRNLDLVADVLADERPDDAARIRALMDGVQRPPPP
jgi:hypothetical protein